MNYKEELLELIRICKPIIIETVEQWPKTTNPANKRGLSNLKDFI